jgi:alcohol dehydrogenase
MNELALLKFALPTFRNARQLVQGSGSTKALSGLQANRVLFFLGSSLPGNEGRLQELQTTVRAKEVSTLVRDWAGEPTLDNIRKALFQVEDFGPDVIVAVGGGAIVDSAKLLWLFYEHPSLSNDILYRPNALPPLRGRAKFVAIPTTIGAGSEVSSAAVLYDPDQDRKVPVVSHDFLPDLVILDPRYVQGLPKKVMAATACDALSHAIEGYVSIIDNPMMDVFAEKAVHEISVHAEAGILYGDMEAIERLQWAATMAGWVQNHCLVGAAHALAHQFRELSHGEANALFLPAVIEANNAHIPGRYDKLASGSGQLNGATGLSELVKRVRDLGDIPTSIERPTDDRAATILQNALADPAGRGNPVALSSDFLADILEVNSQ